MSDNVLSTEEVDKLRCRHPDIERARTEVRGKRLNALCDSHERLRSLLDAAHHAVAEHSDEAKRYNNERDALIEVVKRGGPYYQHAQACPMAAPDWIDSDECHCGIHEWVESLRTVIARDAGRIAVERYASLLEQLGPDIAEEPCDRYTVDVILHGATPYRCIVCGHWRQEHPERSPEEGT